MPGPAESPIIERWDAANSLVTFRWRGEATSTSAWWNIDVPLERTPGTDLWEGSIILPSDLHTLYCIVHGDTREIPLSTALDGPAHLDPGNPRRVHFEADPLDAGDEDGWASELILPAAPPQPWTVRQPGVTPGILEQAELTSGTGRCPVTFYRPAGLPVTDVPTVVVFDGYNALTLLAVPTILDNLIAAGRIPPLTALLVHTFAGSRMTMLRPEPALEHFVTGELLPWARARWGAGSPGRDLVAGVSFGGLAAAHLGLRRPDVFGAVIAQSGSFWYPSPDEGEPGRLIRDVAGLPRGGARFWLDAGTLETMPGPGDSPSLLTSCRAMRDALLAHGHTVTYAEYTGGHDYVNWRRTFADAIQTVCEQ